MGSIRIVRADLADSAHQRAIVDLLDAYSRDPMGDGKPLPDDVKARLIPGLHEHPTTLIYLAYADERAIGIAVCFRGFSTFRAKPLINLHDLAVLPEARGQGAARLLLETVIEEARNAGCCKVTLETQEGNQRAQRLYRALGFARDVHVPEAGGAIFMTCAL